MQVSKIGTSNYSFKALDVSRVSKTHMKEAVEPCLEGLKDLAKDYDIKMKSSNLIVKHGRDYEIFKPVIDVFINPLKEINEKRGIFEIKGHLNLIAGTGFRYVPSTKNNQSGALLLLARKEANKLC